MSQDTTWKHSLDKLQENGIKEQSDFPTPHSIEGENEATAMMQSLPTVNVIVCPWDRNMTERHSAVSHLLQSAGTISTSTSANTVQCVCINKKKNTRKLNQTAANSNYSQEESANNSCVSCLVFFLHGLQLIIWCIAKILTFLQGQKLHISSFVCCLPLRPNQVFDTLVGLHMNSERKINIIVF